MEPLSEKPSLKLTIKLPKRENDRADSSSVDHPSSNIVEDKDTHPSLSALPQSECDNTRRTDTDNDLCANESNQLVPYNPPVDGLGHTEPIPEPSHARRTWSHRRSSPNVRHRDLPSIGAFTVQCANCFKWRLIPTEEKYEEIREHILEQPFYCETAREWRPDIKCDDPEDISQDGSRVWAIDRPNIARTPPGWERQLRIRAEGGSKFADVYYLTPTGKRLRSMVQVQTFLEEHPEYVSSSGLTLSRFSFKIPQPLDEDYCKKRQKPDSEDVQPLSIEGPDSSTNLQLGMPVLPPPPLPSSNSEAQDVDSVGELAKKRTRVDI